MKEVYIVSVARTPIGSFNGALSSFSAPQLGSIAIKAALEKIKLDSKLVNEVYMGNVLTAGVGQAPATQASIYSGIPNTTPVTTINKVCASGMKAIMLGASSIMLGENEVVVAGGMESMSNVPYYLSQARNGYRLGNGQVVDGIIKDGLWDVYKDFHMGNAAEICAKECNISRQEQDAYATESYKRVAEAYKNGWFNDEICTVEIDKKGEKILVKEDEEYKNVKFDKIPTLRPAFQKDGTVTAANSSKINDGAAAVILMSKEKANELGIKPLAKIISFADAQQAPEWFTTAPSKAIPKALKKVNIDINKVDYFEINEAFSVVAIANNNEMKINPAKANVFGGAVALGHPIGCSGARIVITLLSVLKNKNGKTGVAAICNGGGGASAMVLEKM